MSMKTPIGNITQTTPIKDFKELDEMQNEQYLLGIDDNEVGNGSKISLENLINSSISANNGNLITKGTDNRLLVNTPVEIGDLSDLVTTNKSTLVAAINEVDGDVATEVTNRVNAVSAEATTRANADNNLQSQIDAITAASDVTDIVGTYAELQAYDTTGLADKSVIKVLQDESRQNETTYYRWVITGGIGAWVLIGEEGPYYTISQADSKFATRETVGNLNNLATSEKSSIVNAMNELASVLDPTQTADYIKNSKAIYSGEVSENASILPQIKEMSHSTFDRSKFTVVGSPTITDDGIASGFSNSNYLNISNINIGANKQWKVTFKAPVPTRLSNNQLFYGTFLHGTMSANNNIWFQLYLSDNTNHNCYITIPTSYQGTYYDAELSYDGINTYSAKIVLNDGTVLTNSFTSTAYLNSFQTFLGQKFLDSSSIDLKQFSITVDGVEVFSGNKTGIDTIKPDDYTVVGTPTISTDGVASGFNSSNYITNNFANLSNNFCIFGSFKTSDDVNSLQSFCGTFDTKYINNDGIEIRIGDNKFRIFLSSTGTTWDIASNINGIHNILANTTYFWKLKFDGEKYSFSYSLDGENYINDIEVNSSLAIFYGSSSKFILGLRIASSASKVFPFLGSIDLNAFKIYVDGNLVYQPCLKIPYTEAKTGSKIVDSQYRDRVNDMYEQFGYANYYTLSDTDFTLPQGELYGYIEKRARDIARPVGVPFYRFDDTINDDEVRLEGAEVDKGLYLAIEQKLSALCTAGSTEDKICLPDFRNRVAWGANDFGYIEAGLPNIAGSFVSGSEYFSDNVSGASGGFSLSQGSGRRTSGGSSATYDIAKISFDTSISSSIYGNSNTVQPPAVKVRWLARWK